MYQYAAFLMAVSQKECGAYFLDNFVKHCPILVIFCTQHYEET